jgi:hypothetical protein
MNLLRKTILSMTSGVMLLTSPAFAADAVDAQDGAVDPPVQEWSVAIDPLYFWLPGFNGNMRVFGNNASIDVKPRDILANLGNFLEALDGLYMGSGEARKGNFGLQYDIVYLSLGATQNLGDITGGLGLGFSYATGTFAGNYRFYETLDSSLDVIGGIRVTDVQTDLRILAPPAVTDGDTWVDPVVGLKGRHDFNENWFVKGSALYGGFGVSSKSLYDVGAFVGYEWANGIELYGGWRIANTNYSNGSFKWDVTTSGPMMGLTFKR